jgi:hypothetical protein
MRVEVAGYEGAEENEVYEFHINMDDRPLLNEIKQRRLDEAGATEFTTMRIALRRFQIGYTRSFVAHLRGRRLGWFPRG